MRYFLLAFGLVAFGLFPAAKAAPLTSSTLRVVTPMGEFRVEAQMGYHACLFIPAKGVFYHPQQKKAKAQMRLWDKAEHLCLAFNKVDALALRLGDNVNLNYRERAAITELLGWRDQLSLVAHEYGLISRLEKIGRRFRRLQR